jgi:biopolymer transport protein ExbB
LIIPASASLTLPADGAFTFSAWVKTAAPQPRAALYVRREGDSALIIGLDGGVPFVEVHGASGVQRAAAPAAITGNQWTHIAVTAGDKAVTLYVNGRAAAALAGALPALATPTALGGDVGAGSSDITSFVGEMDEARLSRVARPAPLIAVDGADQKQAGIGFGSLGLIVTHVDAPAWFIIALLAVLAVASWFVMWTKTAYVNRVDRANGEFLEFFHEHGGEPAALESQMAPGRFDDSSIYRVYHAGTEEMMRRAKRGQTRVTEQGVEVIRSLMNTRLVRENQGLSRALVILTIAISGGPFLGLLGTVVGVMITFADIAAAGDVNINAIAPGISAALLATIAGLAVAIPALFGYNYILLRNKNVSANMLVFVDEFVTRISETHRDAERPLAAE